MYILFFILSLALDQYTKYLVSCNMTENQTIPIISGIFDLTYVRNTGAAFGMLAGRQTVLVIVTGLLILLISAYAIIRRKKISRLESISLALISAGGLGNLITRIMYNYVIDFFNFYFWPVFNVADIAICVGCALLIIAVFAADKKAERTDL